MLWTAPVLSLAKVRYWASWVNPGAARAVWPRRSCAYCGRPTGTSSFAAPISQICPRDGSSRSGAISRWCFRIRSARSIRGCGCGPRSRNRWKCTACTTGATGSGWRSCWTWWGCRARPPTAIRTSFRADNVSASASRARSRRNLRYWFAMSRPRRLTFRSSRKYSICWGSCNAN